MDALAQPSHASSRSAAAEWRQFGYLPFIAALGLTNSGLASYMTGPFMRPLHDAFGWSHAQLSIGVSIATLGQALGTLIIGRLVDRVGPRRIAIVGTLLLPAAVALLSTATGTIGNWVALWIVFTLCSYFVQTMVWTSAVVSRFERSRGFALALTLSGASITAAAAPVLATWLINRSGWRAAYVEIGCIWALATFPPVLLLFRGVRDRSPTPGQSNAVSTSAVAGLTLNEALHRPAFYQILFAAGFFATCIIASAVHFVPMLTASGASPMIAASAASFIGIFSLLGRLGTGLLLDRLPSHLVGATSFLVPIPGAALLLSGWPNAVHYFIAAAAFGLTLGSEMDMITYLASRHFGLRHFGIILGALLCATSIGGGIGAYGAGALFDHFGSYRPFLLTTLLLMSVSSVLMACLPRSSQSKAVFTV